MKLTIEITKIIYKKETYQILKANILKIDEDVFLPSFDLSYIVDYPYFIQKEEVYEIEGELKKSKKGDFVEVSNLKRIYNNGEKAILKFLKNYAKIGEATSQKLLNMYGLETIEKCKVPSNILKVKGIKEDKANLYSNNILKNLDIEKMIIFCFTQGLTVSQTFFILKNDIDRNYIIQNPYCLTEIEGIGFKTVDKIANNLGFAKNNDIRLQEAIKYYLLIKLNNNGDLYTEKENILININKFLDVNSFFQDNNFTENEINESIKQLESNKKIVIENNNIYIRYYNYVENQIVKLVSEKLQEKTKNIDINKIDKFCEKYQLAENQIKAVEKSLNNNFSILTGGPGTGKTHTTNVIIKAFESLNGGEVALLAPTGKAAKRMTELTGREAKTIHRALGLLQEDKELNEIEADLVVIDEASMIDAIVFFKLMENIKEDAKVVLVGDWNQLPSVGAGLIFRDLINSQVVPATELNEIFRQAKDSKIVLNAHSLINGNDMDLNNSDDFYYIKRDNNTDIKNTILKSINNLIKNKGFKLDDIQILSPMKNGEIGSKELNKQIQIEYSNHKDFYIDREYTYKVGDKVIQTINNYDLNVFNGETGIITKIYDENIVVDFGDKDIIYQGELIKEIELSYAITIHKSQGSEFPVVIIPISKSNKILNNKNLLYTAITRAQKIVILIGEEDELKEIKDRVENLNRNSKIKEKLYEKAIKGKIL